MREAFCLVSLIIVVVFGWNQSYSHHYHALPWVGESEPAATPAPTPAPRRGILPPAAPGAPVEKKEASNVR